LSFDILHDNLGCAIYLNDIVNSYDVDMVQLCREPRLPQQSDSSPLSQVGIIDNLDGHTAIKQLVVSEIQNSHPSATELAFNPVAFCN
jgi:hypothetical protein